MKPHIFRAILSALLLVLVFSFSFILTFLIVGSIVYILIKMPILGKLIDWLFYFRGDTPDFLVTAISAIIAYVASTEVSERINKDAPTIGLSCILVGSILALFHIPSLIINLIYHGNVMANIIQLVAGIGLIVHGKNEWEIKESK